MLNVTSKSKDLEGRISRFDDISISYDLYRPGYPDNLFDDLIWIAQITSKSKVLEIGSGSGKATLGLARKKVPIVCIDPSENLIKIAKKKLREFDIKFVNTTFEEWLGETNYDLIFSAQAFHWVKQEVSYKKAFETLNKNGYLALVWNMYLEPPVNFRYELQEIFRAYPPELYIYNYSKKMIRARFQEIENSCYFDKTIVKEYYWENSYTKEQLLGFFGTFGAFSRLDSSLRKKFYTEIGNLVDDHGGKINQQFTSILYVSQRK